MEKAHPVTWASKGRDGEPVVADYRKLSNGELHLILSVVDPRMCSFAVTDETRETVIAMLDFVATGQR
jgi:hypothetical protein